MTAQRRRRASITVDTEAPYRDGELGAYDYARVLEEFGARGTFFIADDIARANPKLVEDLAAAGHEIASHGTEHPYISKRPQQRPPLLPGIGEAELEDQLGTAYQRLSALAGEPRGFRAMCFETDVSVMRVVAKHFKYDSSLTAGQAAKFKLPPGLVELPVSTFLGGGLRVGTPLFLGPGSMLPLSRLSRATRDDPIVIYGHSFDTIRCTQRLYTSRFKRFWYFERCGPDRIDVIRRIVRGLIESGIMLQTAAVLAETEAPLRGAVSERNGQQGQRSRQADQQAAGEDQDM